MAAAVQMATAPQQKDKRACNQPAVDGRKECVRAVAWHQLGVGSASGRQHGEKKGCRQPAESVCAGKPCWLPNSCTVLSFQLPAQAAPTGPPPRITPSCRLRPAGCTLMLAGCSHVLPSLLDHHHRHSFRLAAARRLLNGHAALAGQPPRSCCAGLGCRARGRRRLQRRCWRAAPLRPQLRGEGRVGVLLCRGRERKGRHASQHDAGVP